MNIVATEMITLGDISWDMILGGFALFLFGIKFMGDGLKNVAGHKLREYIDKYTSNPLMAVLVGIVVTIVVQSSSAATAITIGLVRAGLMKLEQAAGAVSYTHLRAHETGRNLVCRLLLEKKKTKQINKKKKRIKTK